MSFSYRYIQGLKGSSLHLITKMHMINLFTQVTQNNVQTNFSDIIFFCALHHHLYRFVHLVLIHVSLTKFFLILINLRKEKSLHFFTKKNESKKKQCCGSGSARIRNFCRIRIRNSRVSAPDPGPYPKMDVNIYKNHQYKG
jgi:hypothetical protein